MVSSDRSVRGTRFALALLAVCWLDAAGGGMRSARAGDDPQPAAPTPRDTVAVQPGETLYVSPTRDGGWAAWVVRDDQRVEIPVPQKRDALLQFAQGRQLEVNWYIQQSPRPPPKPETPPQQPTATPERRETILPVSGASAHDEPARTPPAPQPSKPAAKKPTTSGKAAPPSPADPKKPAAPASPDKTPAGPDAPTGKTGKKPASEAEQITRLQRAIEDDEQRIAQLQAEQDDPQSEYAQAEAAFKEIDGQLEEQKTALQSLKDEGAAEQAATVEAAIGETSMRWRLARERFELSIETRKTWQDQMTALEQKLQQDRKALENLTAPRSPEPAADKPAPTPPASAVVATATEPATVTAALVPGMPAAPAPAADAAPEQPESAPADKSTDQTAAAKPETPAAAPAKPPSKALQHAQHQAVEKVEAAQEAEQAAQSLTERIAVRDRSIQLERKLLDAFRKKADLADKTRRALGDAHRRKSAEGAPRAELQELAAQIHEAEDRFHAARQEVAIHTDRLDELQSQRADIQAEQVAALKEAGEKRQQADQAQQEVQRLQNPFSPHNLMQWSIDHGPKILMILLAMLLLRFVAGLFTLRVAKIMARSGIRGSREERQDRANTLVGVLHSAASIAIIVGGVLMVCEECGIAVGPLMGGAAVFGLAVAFGAQNLIRDYFYGFVILLENQYKINDVVKIGAISGQVERITLRVTILRDLEGSVHFIPNGKIDSVTNMTHGWSRALFEIRVAYKEDPDRVMALLLDLARELRADPAYGRLILDDAEMLGLDSFGDSAVNLKFFIKTRPLKQWQVKRELNRRIKKRFDELGIEIPFPHRTIFHHHDNPAAPSAREEPGDEWFRQQSA